MQAGDGEWHWHGAGPGTFIPRNNKLTGNKNPGFFDMGICGPFRTDMKDQTQYCGMFLTPTLRNTATRHAFFHNGVYSTLDDVMAFYNDRNTAPEKVLS